MPKKKQERYELGFDDRGVPRWRPVPAPPPSSADKRRLARELKEVEQRRFDRRLNQAKTGFGQALDNLSEACETLLSLDPENSDATRYLALVRESFGITPLHMVIHEDDPLEVARLLIDRGADIEAKNLYGRTPLLNYCFLGGERYTEETLQVVRLLIDRGADIEAKDQYGSTPLWSAATSNFLEVATLLIDRGADIEGGGGDARPLEEADSRGAEYEEVISLLIDRGANTKNIDLSWMD